HPPLLPPSVGTGRRARETRTRRRSSGSTASSPTATSRLQRTRRRRSPPATFSCSHFAVGLALHSPPGLPSHRGPTVLPDPDALGGPARRTRMLICGLLVGVLVGPTTAAPP